VQLFPNTTIGPKNSSFPQEKKISHFLDERENPLFPRGKVLQTCVVSRVMQQLIIHDRSDGIHQHHSSLLWRGSTLTTPFWPMVLESYPSNDT